MKICIIGTRGIPAKYGGFETFAQELSPLLVHKGVECFVFCDQDSHNEPMYNGVFLEFLNTTKSKNPLRYYFQSLKRASKICEIIFVAGSGGAIFYPLFRKKGRILITNTDGIEYKRDKWSLEKKIFLKISEYLAANFSNYIVADSSGIKKHLIETYKIDPEKIWQLEYGADLNNYKNPDVLNEFQIEDNNYYLIVSRLEPENNVHLMIEGYLSAFRNKPLVIVGNLENNQYVADLLSKKTENIRFLGGIYDSKKLKALRTSCFAHLHGHSVGGTNPSLLEALGSGNIIIAHDNIFNREVAGENMFYFKNQAELNSAFEKIEGLTPSERNQLSQNAQNRITEYYNWDSIADRYYKYLQSIQL